MTFLDDMTKVVRNVCNSDTGRGKGLERCMPKLNDDLVSLSLS